MNMFLHQFSCFCKYQKPVILLPLVLWAPSLCRILHKLWYVLIGVVQGRMVVIPRNPSVIYLYERLYFFMMALKTFFHADGNGMALTNLETEPYKVGIATAQDGGLGLARKIDGYCLELF